MAEIDPTSDQLVARYPLTGCKGSYGLLIDAVHRLAFAACEKNARLVVFDLETKKTTATLSVGADPQRWRMTKVMVVCMSLPKARHHDLRRKGSRFREGR